MRKPSRLALAAFLTGCCLFNPAAQAVEREDESDGGRTGFLYGGDCNQLAQLSRREIQAVTHAVHIDNFDHFCFAQGIYSCSDYTAMLRGAGSLEENDSFGCTLSPRAH